MNILFLKRINSGAFRGSVLFFILLFLLCPAASNALEARVKYVIDGDTFVLEDNRSVRIASIDTPEIGRHGDKDQYYAANARHELNSLLRGNVVRIELAGDHKDHYDRLVGWVYVDSLFVNEHMVRQGYAFYYYHKNNKRKFQNILLQAQTKAYKEKKGFWPVIVREKGFDKIWIGNRNSYRCFPENHKTAKRISRRNRVFFPNLGKAFESGYSPARNVGFWPLVK